mmetsp:Transcript_14675/g.34018  ORF Transcript_14675/g.34018 Transcript_14675/m.34018 type:complete len:197 (-) Transcript_14675:430-1020(-)
MRFCFSSRAATRTLLLRNRPSHLSFAAASSSSSSVAAAATRRTTATAQWATSATRSIGTLAGGNPPQWFLSTANVSVSPSVGVGPRRFFSGDSSSSSSSSLTPQQIQSRLNEFQDLFVEARLCIDDVKDSVGTVYFEDDSEEAREAVDAAIECFEKLLSEIKDVDERNKVLRSNGLKVEQLKGELELTLGEHDDHH